MVLRVDHVSVAVKDIGKARDFFIKVLGAVPGAGAPEPVKKFSWEIFSLGDLSRIELIAPTGPGSFIDRFLDDRGGGVHHITLQVSDIDAARTHLESSGIPYFEGTDYGDVWKEIFIHPRDAFGVLIQLAQFSAPDWLSDRVKIPGGKRWSVERKDGGCALHLKHPGGGSVNLDLQREEMKMLVRELGDAL